MHRNLLLNLLRAVYWYADAMHANMARQGHERISRAASFVLLNIAQGEHRAINIARNLGISRQAVSQMITDMCNRGLLIMRDDPKSGRSRIVDFSPAFASQGAICAEMISKLEREICSRVGSEDFEAMSRALAATWGGLPKFSRLSRAELEHGKEVWQEEFVELNHSARPAAARQVVPEPMTAMHQAGLPPKAECAAARSRRIFETSDPATFTQAHKRSRRNP